jgi:pimeloyl-ACP methyl ester carboxylesterase
VVRLAVRAWGDAASGDLLDAAGPGWAGDGRAAAAGARTRGRRPLAVLVHGVTSSSRTWWRAAPALVELGFHVLAVDLRGHGASARIAEGLGLPDLAADLAATVQSEGTASQPPIDLLVGHSLGALVVSQLLAMRPGLARRLVLEDPPGLSTTDWAALADGIEADGARARIDPEALRRDLLAEGGGAPPGEVDRQVADLADCDAAGIAAALRRQVVYDLPGLVEWARVPTLLLIGEEALGSALVGPDRAALIGSLDRAAVEVLQAGHNLHREAFGAFMAAIERWLDREAGLEPGFPDRRSVRG